MDLYSSLDSARFEASLKYLPVHVPSSRLSLVYRIFFLNWGFHVKSWLVRSLCPKVLTNAYCKRWIYEFYRKMLNSLNLNFHVIVPLCSDMFDMVINDSGKYWTKIKKKSVCLSMSFITRTTFFVKVTGLTLKQDTKRQTNISRLLDIIKANIIK